MTEPDKIVAGIERGYWWVMFKHAPEDPPEIAFVTDQVDDDLFQEGRFARGGQRRSVNSARRLGYVFLSKVAPFERKATAA
jgi:hypothetical protein